MNNTYIDNWQAVEDRFEQWWDYKPLDKPLMRIVASGKPDAGYSQKFPAYVKPREPKDAYLDVRNIIMGYRSFFETHYFLADAFPTVDINLGPGSMALYLGGDPGVFTFYSRFFPI